MNKEDFALESPGKLVPTEFLEYPNGPLSEPNKIKTVATGGLVES